MAPVLVAALALPFVLFGLLSLARRARFRSLAAELGGTHVGAWPFAPGRVRGDDFEIAPEKVGKSYRTLVRVTVARGTPGTYLLKPEFFERFPDWSCARVHGTRQQRLFLWEVSLPGLAEPDAEQRERLLRWLALPRHADVGAALRSAKVPEVLVADGSVSTSLRGIVGDRERVRRTLEALRALSSSERRAAAG